MNPKFKLVLYVVLLGTLVVCALQFMKTSREVGSPLAPPTGTNPPPATGTITQAVAAAASTAATHVATHPATNAPGTNAAVAAPAATEDISARRSSARLGRMMGYGIVGFFALIGLSVMIGYDVSRFMANRVEEFVFNDDLKGVKDPDYEEAENMWAKGQHLEAVQLMRDFYKRNPSEVYAALRIAEIYETNLQNYLAAALEYEEVLKRKLPAERWGWAAIHLANLYSGKLNKIEQATALLHRIVNEYGQTAAAKKARERLGIPEPTPAEVIEAAEAAQAEPATPAAPKPESNLPPGFRPK